MNVREAHEVYLDFEEAHPEHLVFALNFQAKLEKLFGLHLGSIWFTPDEARAWVRANQNLFPAGYEGDRVLAWIEETVVILGALQNREEVTV